MFVHGYWLGILQRLMQPGAVCQCILLILILYISNINISGILYGINSCVIGIRISCINASQMTMRYT